LNLDDSDPDWGAPLPPRPELTMAQTIKREVQWARAFFIPWLIRRARGVSLGDGMSPKRPEMTPVVIPAGVINVHDPAPLWEPGCGELSH
jgi:hypothetical protein